MAKQSNRKQTKQTNSSRQTEKPASSSRETDKPGSVGAIGSQLATTPFTLMKRFGEEMDRLFEDVGLNRGWLNSIGRDLGMWTPQVEMFEREGELVVRADLPGLTKDDVNVELSDGGITIEGERREEKSEKREGFYRNERHYGKFYRRLPLPEGVDVQDANATFRDGVLEITMSAPKRKESKPRRLSIQDDSPPQAKQQAA
jgi:HSP20 family protein